MSGYRTAVAELRQAKPESHTCGDCGKSVSDPEVLCQDCLKDQLVIEDLPGANRLLLSNARAAIYEYIKHLPSQDSFETSNNRIRSYEAISFLWHVQDYLNKTRGTK